jgi:uncharacterized membrane protein (UPF0127 family)
MAALRNATDGTILAARVSRLRGFRARTLGLLTRATLERDEGVWLAPCRAIHTVGMRYAIDVVFVDRAGCVVRLCRNVRPNRLVVTCAAADAVVELRGGALDVIAVRLGDRILLDDLSADDRPAVARPR